MVIIDKVLVHRGLTSLDVLVFGLVVVSVFEVLLGGLRTYLFSHTTNRIDVELGTRLFKHLLHLPISYFGARRVSIDVPAGQVIGIVGPSGSGKSTLTKLVQRL